MKAWDIMAYAYDAALHCPECTLKHFSTDLHPITESDLDGLLDSEDNEVTPVFVSNADEFSSTDCCDDCGLVFVPDEH